MKLQNQRATQLKAWGVNLEDESIFGELLRKSYDDDFEPSKMPAQPTHHQPGSIGKLVVMSMRLMAGEELHHPGDERITASPVEQAKMGQYCRMVQEIGGGHAS